MDALDERNTGPALDKEDAREIAEVLAKLKLPADVRTKITYLIEGAKLVSDATEKAS